jgi:hypothetical protein
MAILLHLKGSLVETLHGSPVPVGHYDVNQDGSSVCLEGGRRLRSLLRCLTVEEAGERKSKAAEKHRRKAPPQPKTFDEGDYSEMLSPFGLLRYGHRKGTTAKRSRLATARLSLNAGMNFQFAAALISSWSAAPTVFADRTVPAASITRSTDSSDFGTAS